MILDPISKRFVSQRSVARAANLTQLIDPFAVAVASLLLLLVMVLL